MPLVLSIDTGPSHHIPDFWELVGPKLADKHIAADLGAHPKDDPETIWFVATSERNRILAGFCSAKVTPRKVELKADYTVPAYRRLGVYSHLSERRDAWLINNYPATPHEIVTRRKWLIVMYQNMGYRQTQQRGSFTVLQRSLQTTLV